MEILGIDVGGAGIKAAPVDTKTGKLLEKRRRLETPERGRPQEVLEVMRKLAADFSWKGPVGCGFPAAIKGGVVRTASNIDKTWVGVDLASALKEMAPGNPVGLINDADAAGIAEIHLGAGRDRGGVVLLVTIGTGLGTALFTDGVLLPNVEMGGMELDGQPAEERASGAARNREGLSWKKWTPRFEKFLRRMEDYFWPDLIIVGGGASKKHEKFFELLDVRTELAPARFFNDAGIVGAALAAEDIASGKLKQP